MTSPRHRYIRKRAVQGLLLLGAVASLADPAGAFEIRGTVVNGTTGKPVGAIEVAVVDPRHGMAAEGKIRTNAQGAFVAPDLSDEISMFLVQASYEGVTYTEIVQPSKGAANVEVKVYDTTTSWDDVGVSLPHFMARRSDDTLSIDRVFVVSNHTQPPKTVYGQNAGFRLNIPEERLQITSLFATSLGFPIGVTPHPTASPGLYTIDYPFKPGETQVGVSFDVPYPDTGYVYTETLPYALDEVVVMTEDPEMDVTGASVKLGAPEEVRGFKAYRLSTLPKSSVLALGFRGGSARALPQASGHEIVTLREPRERGTIAIIAGFTLLLVLIMAFASKSPFVETDRTALLVSRRNSTLNRIARLDDLFEMGTVPERLYRDKRAELVQALSLIMHQIDRARPATSKTARKTKGTPDAR
jgi:hypothetical protein